MRTHSCLCAGLGVPVCNEYLEHVVHAQHTKAWWRLARDHVLRLATDEAQIDVRIEAMRLLVLMQVLP